MSRHWPKVRLGEVLQPVARSEAVDAAKEYRLLGVRLDGQGPFLRETVTGAQTSASKLSRVAAGDFIYSRLFAWRGAFGIIAPELDGCYVSGEFPTFLPAYERLDIRFLRYWFTLPKTLAFVDENCSGSTPLTRNRFKEEYFLALEIPLPPLAEQRRIVTRIEELAAQIHGARALREQASTEADLVQYAAMRRLRHTVLKDNFPTIPIGEITTVTSGGTPPRDNPSYWNGNIPWIKTGELLDGDILTAEEHIADAGVANSSAKIFPPQTVLIALYGQGQTRGRTGRLLIPAATNQACCAILPNEEKLEPRFVQYWLRGLYFELREQAQGGAQPNWNGGMIKALLIPLPPISEQRRIVAELDALQAEVDTLKRHQAENAAELDALLPAILDRAFRGEL
jgi:type I restriction enzyme S subunit